MTRARQNAFGVRGRDGYPGGILLAGGKSLGKGAMARTTAGRHLHRARATGSSTSRSGPPSSSRSSCRSSSRCSSRSSAGADAPSSAPPSRSAARLGASRPTAASPSIRVAIVDGVRTVEIGGGPMMVSDLAGRPLGGGRARPGSAPRQRQASVEVRGRTRVGGALARADGRRPALQQARVPGRARDRAERRRA